MLVTRFSSAIVIAGAHTENMVLDRPIVPLILDIHRRAAERRGWGAKG
jgi:hypothetical protein